MGKGWIVVRLMDVIDIGLQEREHETDRFSDV